PEVGSIVRCEGGKDLARQAESHRPTFEHDARFDRGSLPHLRSDRGRRTRRPYRERVEPAANRCRSMIPPPKGTGTAPGDEPGAVVFRGLQSPEWRPLLRARPWVCPTR